MPTRTFNFTGEWEKWSVPADVEVVTVEMTGGGSGTVEGGKVTGTLRVKSVDALWIKVGRKGFAAEAKSGGDGCFGGGGPGGKGGSGTGRHGGDGGGGATAIRNNKKDGTLRAVAGGAGGTSGDGSLGGPGGASTGGQGTHSAIAGSTAVGDATGGTQNQPGRGGTSRDYTGLWGNDAESGHLGQGGRGGQSGLSSSHGGGGGGGGYFAGGGGQGAAGSEAPGGGGAGGSNYTGGLFGAVVSTQGTGGTGHGSVTLTWDTTNPPTPPTNITIDGQPIADGLATKAKNSVVLRGTPDDPDAVRGVRMFVWMSTDETFAHHRTFRGTYDAPEHRDKVTLTPLEQDNRYYLRLYTQDVNGNVSTSYRTTNFWTNRRPDPPTLTAPAENGQVAAILNVTFTWNSVDPDPADPQKAFRFRWRKMATPLEPAGEWVEIEHAGSTESWVVDAGTFSGNTFYEWSVRTQDQQDRWGEYAASRSFFVTADTTPPELLAPINGIGVIAGQPTRFMWRFKTPLKARGQSRADLRYRRWLLETEWTTLFGDPTTPGSEKSWTLPADTFDPKHLYEWQARTYDTDNNDSDWSGSSYFWTTITPGSGAGLDPIISPKPGTSLGEGRNRVMVFQRGGTVLLGELTPLVDVKWERRRDDISTAILHMNQWDDDVRGLLREIRSWKHELVIFREVDGVTERVFEGPIVRKASRRDGLEIEAKDVMGYLYRRIMRQGYNDSYRVVDGQQQGLSPVTQRAKQIILNALAYDDPNVLPYLTTFEYDDDARSSRVREDFSTTAWEEIDDLAAHAGLDYVTSGRRIILNDTHRPVGRLPEMRDGHFSESPIITEYGASLANVFAVTNNAGIYGIATRGLDAAGLPGEEGFVEQLASSYSESEGAGTERTLTREARRRLEESLREQAQRNIAGRWTAYGPSPIVVRIPDSATLVPNLPIGINQLIPGVWIPLRCEDGIQQISQWQKLDLMSVAEDANGEKVSVTMSPAPNDGEDPDADVVVEDS